MRLLCQEGLCVWQLGSYNWWKVLRVEWFMGAVALHVVEEDHGLQLDSVQLLHLGSRIRDKLINSLIVGYNITNVVIQFWE